MTSLTCTCLSLSAQDSIGGEKQKGLVLFASIRRLNRLSHLYCKDAREQTQEVKENTGATNLLVSASAEPHSSHNIIVTFHWLMMINILLPFFYLANVVACNIDFLMQ